MPKNELSLLEQDMDEERIHAVLDVLRNYRTSAAARLLDRELRVGLDEAQRKLESCDPNQPGTFGFYQGVCWAIRRHGEMADNLINQLVDRLESPTENSDH